MTFAEFSIRFLLYNWLGSEFYNTTLHQNIFPFGLMLTTLDLWKSRGIGRDVFLKLIPRDCDRQRSTNIGY
jgi:hypothetical protein